MTDHISSATDQPTKDASSTAGERLDQLKGVNAFVHFNGPDWMCDAVEWAIYQLTDPEQSPAVSERDAKKEGRG